MNLMRICLDCYRRFWGGVLNPSSEIWRGFGAVVWLKQSWMLS